MDQQPLQNLPQIRSAASILSDLHKKVAKKVEGPAADTAVTTDLALAAPSAIATRADLQQKYKTEVLLPLSQQQASVSLMAEQSAQDIKAHVHLSALNDQPQSLFDQSPIEKSFTAAQLTGRQPQQLEGDGAEDRPIEFDSSTEHTAQARTPNTDDDNVKRDHLGSLLRAADDLQKKFGFAQSAYNSPSAHRVSTTMAKSLRNDDQSKKSGNVSLSAQKVPRSNVFPLQRTKSIEALPPNDSLSSGRRDSRVSINSPNKLRTINSRDKTGRRTRLQKICLQSRTADLLQLCQEIDDHTAQRETDDAPLLLDVMIYENSQANAFHHACVRGNSTNVKIMLERHAQYYELEYDEKCMQSNEAAIDVAKDGFSTTDYSGALGLHQRDIIRHATPMHDIVYGLFNSLAVAVDSGGKMPGYKMEYDLCFAECCRLLLQGGYTVSMLDEHDTAEQMLDKSTANMERQHAELFEQSENVDDDDVFKKLIDQIDQIKAMFIDYRELVFPLMQEVDYLDRGMLHYVSLQPDIDPITSVNSALRSGLDIGSQDAMGMTVLHNAVSTCNVQLVYYLCSLSSNMSLVEKKRQSSEDGKVYFSRRAHFTMLQKSASPPFINDDIMELPSICNAQRETALHTCVQAVNKLDDIKNYNGVEYEDLLTEYLAIARTLIVAGVDMSAVDLNGSTAFDLCTVPPFIEEISKLVNILVIEGVLKRDLYLGSDVPRVTAAGKKGVALMKPVLSTRTPAKTKVHRESQSGSSGEERLSDGKQKLTASAQSKSAVEDASVILTHMTGPASAMQQKAKRKLLQPSTDPEQSKMRSQIQQSTDTNVSKRSRREQSTDTLVNRGEQPSKALLNGRQAREPSHESTVSGASSNMVNKSSRKTGKNDPLDPYKIDDGGRTRMHHMARAGNLASVRTLVERGADVNAADYGGYTPLSEAANNGHHDVVEYLLQHSAKINVHGIEGETPLQEAVKGCDAETVRLLLDYGADPFATNNEGLIARDFLESNKTSPHKGLLNADRCRATIRDLLDNYDANQSFVKIKPKAPTLAEVIALSKGNKMREAVAEKSTAQSSIMVDESVSNISVIKKPKSTRKKGDKLVATSQESYVEPQQQASSVQSVVSQHQSVSVEPPRYLAQRTISEMNASAHVGDTMAVDESLLPVLHFTNVSGGNDESYLLDANISRLLGFATTVRMYLFFGKDLAIRQPLREQRVLISPHQLPATQREIPYATSKSYWLPAQLFSDVLLSLFVELSNLDVMDVVDQVGNVRQVVLP